MAYATAHTPNRRIGTLTAVGLVHVLIGYGLITGLATDFIPTPDQIIKATNIKLDPPKPLPTPEPPKPDTSVTPRTTPQDNPYIPPATNSPIAPSTGELITGTTELTGGIGEVTFPVDPPPPPAPSFTPRKAKARGNEAGWVTTNDYPTNDIRLEHEGTTRVRLTVGTNGRVSNCEVTSSSGWPGLDAATCAKLTSRARFEPATDNTGAQVQGTYSTSVLWRIPKE